MRVPRYNGTKMRMREYEAEMKLFIAQDDDLQKQDRKVQRKSLLRGAKLQFAWWVLMARVPLALVTEEIAMQTKENFKAAFFPSPFSSIPLQSHQTTLAASLLSEENKRR